MARPPPISGDNKRDHTSVSVSVLRYLGIGICIDGISRFMY